MPCLHNYVTVDPEKFSSDPKHLEMIYNMCKTVLTANSGEDAECHAAKLIEVLLLQYKGQIDSVSDLLHFSHDEPLAQTPQGSVQPEGNG